MRLRFWLAPLLVSSTTTLSPLAYSDLPGQLWLPSYFERLCAWLRELMTLESNRRAMVMYFTDRRRLRADYANSEIARSRDDICWELTDR